MQSNPAQNRAAQGKHITKLKKHTEVRVVVVVETDVVEVVNVVVVVCTESIRPKINTKHGETQNGIGSVHTHSANKRKRCGNVRSGHDEAHWSQLTGPETRKSHNSAGQHKGSKKQHTEVRVVVVEVNVVEVNVVVVVCTESIRPNINTNAWGDTWVGERTQNGTGYHTDKDEHRVWACEKETR